jgi:acetylornithine deacetylase/succinyl-diaminopimelate desuccinylase-like protein
VPTDLTAEVTDLLQQLIRNGCVNDGTVTSGGEARSVDALESYLGGAGFDVERYEPEPGRASLVARIEGRNPTAPALMLMGHTDVVPVNPDGWRRDPFGGELVDGEIWGRGAVDMLNLTTSMAVAFKHLAASGFRPDGDLVYLAVADEEASGRYGAGHLVDRERDAVRCDYVITEAGGFPIPTPTGTKLPIIVGEKGSWWCTLRVKGTPGHASMPYRTDNALVKAAEVVRRIAEHRGEADMHEIWRRFVTGMEFGPELEAPLLDAAGFDDLLEVLPSVGLARQAQACTHTTFAPTVVHGGTKTNVIPDRVDVQVDIRTLPGQTGADVEAMLADILGDLAPSVEVIAPVDDPSTASPIDTPLWDTLVRVTEKLSPGAKAVPFLTVGATDARFFRRVGATAYGYGLFSDTIDFDAFSTMFHGDNERVDQESLRLSTELWQAVAHDLLVA